jgi:hypothetical protein
MMNNNIVFDPIIKFEILEYLKKCDSVTIWHSLDDIAIRLTHIFPIESVAVWLSEKPSNIKVGTESLYLDDRSTAIVFLRRLSKMDIDNKQIRIPNGSKKPNTENIIMKLSNLPSFDLAINTWMAICEEWLAICNVDTIIELLQKDRPLAPNVNIAKLMVGALEIGIE